MPAFVKDSKAQGSNGPYITQGGILTLASYLSGGYTPVASEAGVLNIARVRPSGPWSAGYLSKWDSASGKLRAYTSGGRVEANWPDVTGGTFAAVATDAAAAKTGDAACLALTDATVTTSGGLASTAGKTTGFTQPNALDAEIPGRNIVIAQNQNGAGGTWSANSAARVTGTDQFGATVTEDIALQVDAIADTKFRLAIGVKVFATITSVRLIRTDTAASQAGPASSRISVGVGTVFALRGTITAEADIYAVRKDNAAIAAATYIGSTTTNSVDLGADCADNVDILVEYLSGLVEVAAGVNVGTLECIFEGD